LETATFHAMNTQVTLAGEGDPSRLKVGFDKAQRYIEQSEIRFSRFSKTSELSRLNMSAGSWFKASPEMIFMVMLINQFNNQTKGLFDPSILPILEYYGYDRSMDQIRSRGDRQLENSAIFPDHKPFQEISVLPQQGLIRLPGDVRIDLGGIAKGWIAEHSAMILADYSPACLVDAGGDMFMVGNPGNQAYWLINIEDPRFPGKVLTSLNVPQGAIATSTVTKRIWKKGEYSHHHLIDPRTNMPAITDWLSVTVLAPHTDTAEVFAKALLIAGSQESESISKNTPDIKYIAIDQAGGIWGNLESLEYIHDYKN
jgi:thiamine biosynthesis lipoprotein